MRVAVGSHFYVPNRMAGSETAVHAALLALVERGHRVTVFCTESGGGYVHEGVRVVESSATRLRSDLYQARPDVVLGQHSQWATVASFAGVARIPSLLYVHNTYDESNVALHRSPTLVAYNTVAARERFSGHRHPSVILHPPVDPAQHRATPGDRVTLINLNRSKGSGVFYAAAAALPETPFLGVEGGHGVQVFEHWPNVEFVGQTPNMRGDVWSRTRVLLMPSEAESYGMVGVEALASGIPVIASAGLPGVQEALGDAAIYLDRDDPQLWANAIKDLSDGRRWNAASRRAKRRSAEIEKERPAELARWVQAVELAHESGRDRFREAWHGRSHCD